MSLSAGPSSSAPRFLLALLAFVEAGVMRQLGRVGQTVDYERIDGPFWDAILILAENWA